MLTKDSTSVLTIYFLTKYGIYALEQVLYLTLVEY